MSENTQIMNLLDLPVEILEEIFLYCVGSGSLLKLTETNSYFKNVIEFSPSLMQHIRLNVNTKHGKSIELQQILEAALKSTRKYKSIQLDLRSDSYGSDLLDYNSGILLKQLFDINAESLKDVEVYLLVAKEEDVFNTLKLFENLLNVENIDMFVDTPRTYFENNAPSRVYQPYNFSKLRFFKVIVDASPMIASSVLNVFQECQTIKTLSLIMYDLEIDQTSFSMLTNSRETLDSLNISFSYREDMTAAERNIKFAELLIALKNCNLNLKYLELHFIEKLDRGNIVRLKDFVMSQRNLKTFKFNCSLNQLLLNNIKDLLASDLKVLQIEYYDFEEENADESLYQPWNLNKLEVFDLGCMSEKKDPNFVFKIFHSPSDILKKIELDCINMGSNTLPNIIRNYRNLTELNLFHCSNHKSDDIFGILKFLKKLKTLSFHFPDESELNDDLFVNSGDLVLPEIYKVHLNFNALIDNFHVIKLMQLVKNVKIFLFYNNRCKNKNNDTLYIITQALPNLMEFLKENGNHSTFEIQCSTLKRIKNNIQQFNKNPHLFRICGKNIDVWIEELSQRQQ